jgi:hypothetical protein
MADDAIPITPDSPDPQPFRPTFPEPKAPPVPAPPTEPTHEPDDGEGEGAETTEPTGVTDPDTGALPGLDKLAMIILVLGLVLLANAITSFLNWMLRAAWPGGGSRARQLQPDATTKALGSYLGTFAQGFDPEVGTSFTQMATTAGLMSRAFVALATRLYHVSEVVSVLQSQASANVDATNALRHKVQVQDAAQVQTVKELQAQIDKEDAAERRTERQLHALERYVTTVLEPELERLRDRLPDLEKGQATTTKRVEQHDTMLGLDAMVGTVALAMAKLGTTYTRCDTNRDIGERICQEGGQGLRNLLRGLMPLLGIAELCALVSAVSAVGNSSLVQDGLGLFTEGIEGLLSCTGATIAPPLPIATPALPPLTAWASLTPVNV